MHFPRRCAFSPGRFSGAVSWVILVTLCAAHQARAQATPPGGPGAGAQLERDLRQQDLQQYELDTRFRADQSVPADQRLLLDYGAYVIYSYLSVDDYAHNNHGLREGDLFAYLRANLDGAQEFFVRTRVGFQDFNNGDNFDGPNNYRSIGFDLDRAYYRLDLSRYNAAYGKNVLGMNGSDGNVVIEGGRDLVYWANGLVMAQVIDGVMVDMSRSGLDLQLIAGVTPVRTVDFDSSRPAFYYNTRRGFFGGMLSEQVGTVRPFFYGLVQRDYNSDNNLAEGPIDTRFSYNSYYLGTGASGPLSDRLRYSVEAAYEGGNTLSNSFQLSPLGGLIPEPQTRDSINAYAADARLDYAFTGAHQSRLGAELILASGDDDRGNSSTTFNGNKSGTKDNSFNGFGLLNTGLAFAPEVSNILALRLGGSTFPLPDSPVFRRFQIGTDFFILGKLDHHAPIDEPTNNHRYLGVEPDIYLNWQATSDVTVALRYGVFVPSSRNFVRDASRQFFYATVTYGF
jgi:hypothetical protein